MEGSAQPVQVRLVRPTAAAWEEKGWTLWRFLSPLLAHSGALFSSVLVAFDARAAVVFAARPISARQPGRWLGVQGFILAPAVMLTRN